MKIKTVKVSDKGQISIPTDIRITVGIKKGDELIIVQEGNKILIEKSSRITEKLKDDFKDLVKHSEKIARELWENEEDEIWDNL